jgi:glycosyltransferase involved in cell wall biosynthesis
MNAVPIPPRESVFSSSEKSRIGIVSPCYGLEKVSYALQPEGFDFFKVTTWPFQKLPSKSNYLDNTRFLFPTKTDLVHTFNKIPINGPRFIVSFELEFPRYFGPVSEKQLNFTKKILRSDRCVALLGLSETAADLAKSKFLTEGEPQIAEKIGVFKGGLPGKELVVKPREKDGPLKLLYVGNDYLRKGLVACAIAVGKLLDQGADIEFNVITNFDPNGYVGEKTEWTESILQPFLQRKQVKVVGPVPNATVKAYMRDSDALLFPTLDESLGWVPIEAGMEGTATIAASIFAIPEFIEHDKTGILLDVTLDSNTRRWEGIDHPNAATLFVEAQKQLAEQLVPAIERFLNDRDLSARLGEVAHTKMMRDYSSHAASDKLASLYKRFTS